MERKDHWERVYTTKGEREVSWFESLPSISLEMLEASGLTNGTCVLDVGGGDSRLVDYLAARGMDCLAVLDVSGAAPPRGLEAQWRGDHRHVRPRQPRDMQRPVGRALRFVKVH